MIKVADLLSQGRLLHQIHVESIKAEIFELKDKRRYQSYTKVDEELKFDVNSSLDSSVYTQSQLKRKTTINSMADITVMPKSISGFNKKSKQDNDDLSVLSLGSTTKSQYANIKSYARNELKVPGRLFGSDLKRTSMYEESNCSSSIYDKEEIKDG